MSAYYTGAGSNDAESARTITAADINISAGAIVD